MTSEEFVSPNMFVRLQREGHGEEILSNDAVIALPQQAQTIESISGHTYIRKRISLTLFIKRLILWSEGLSQDLLSDPTYFVCRAVTFFNKIDLHPYNSYYFILYL